MTKSTAPNPALLAYSRSIIPSDGAFFSVDENGLKMPLPVRVKAALGTQSQYTEDSSPKPGGNPQRVEYVALERGTRKLSIEFGVTVAGASRAPHSCDVPAWRADLMALVKLYAETDRFETLGCLYAANIANGRWAWKNRFFADAFSVLVNASGETFNFDALAHKLDNPAASASDPEVKRLGLLIASGLRGERIVRLSVSGLLTLGDAAEVYPSQEFAEKEEEKIGSIGKVLFGIPVDGVQRCAGLHEQKIGNAIRTIDIWHNGYEEDGVQIVEPGLPLAVNPYGQSRETYIAVRSTGKGNPDLYSLLKAKTKSVIEDLSNGRVSDDAHFIVANLVRGGVFGFEKKAKESKADKPSKPAKRGKTAAESDTTAAAE